MPTAQGFCQGVVAIGSRQPPSTTTPSAPPRNDGQPQAGLQVPPSPEGTTGTREHKH